MANHTVVVKTSDGLTSELTDLAKEILEDWVKTHDANLANVILASMMVVEKYSATIGKLQSFDKYQAAKELMPFIVDLMVAWGKLSEAEGNSLKKKLVKSVDIVRMIVEGYILVSQNPTVIQIKETIKEKTTKCFSLCKKKDSSK